MKSKASVLSRARRCDKPINPSRRHLRRALAVGILGTLCVAGGLAAAALAIAATTQRSHRHRGYTDQPGHGGYRLEQRHFNKDGLGIRPGKIKHVWLIILENKSFDATFSGLNNNTYLWKDLPKQGALLTQYYGTGHFSLDNYISAVSGQATQPDTQADCPQFTSFSAKVDLSGGLKTNPNYGQAVSNAGPNAAPGANGCVYPSSVPTLFNQLDAAGVSWKGYAQDLNTTTTPARTPVGPRTARAKNTVARPTPRRPRRGNDDAAQPRRGERDRPVCAQALPVPLVPVDPVLR